MSSSELNQQQLKAVKHTEGPVMILAGAGSGKTRTLVKRIVYLLEEKGVGPYQVLAVTFSNKAAREMRDRVSSECAIDIGALQITTFHAFCARILRNEASYIGLGKNFTIYDQSESRAVAKAVLAKNGVNLKDVPPKALLYYMDDLKNSGYFDGRKNLDYEIEKDDEFYQYYLEYENELHRSNAVDFGGLITGVLQLFEEFPKILARYQKRFKYVLVDEYQDTNRAQFELVKYLAAENKNICVVGDEDQSIYSWRGADIRNIFDFENIFPGYMLLKLERNYRSSKTIIEAAGHVISMNEMRKGKSMWTDNQEGEFISIFDCQNDQVESEKVVEEIKKLNKKEKVIFKDISIFYRSNAQSRVIEDQLRKHKIPYRVVGGIKFYDRKEIKDMLSYLKVITNSKDSLSFSRIINVPTRGVGAVTLRKLESEAIKKQVSLWEIVDEIFKSQESYEHLRLSRKIKSALSELVTLINEAKVWDSKSRSPSSIYDKVLHESGYLEQLKASRDYESKARIENLEELLNAIKQFEKNNDNPSINGFLESLTLDNEMIEDSVPNQGEVSLMTVHGSKGLEFPYVFIVGAEENTFPSYQSLENGEQAIEEERRLFYVAMTRAMTKLYICFAQARLVFGQLKFNGHSRFIDEIPDKFYKWKRLGKKEDFSEQSDISYDFNQEVQGNYDEPVYRVESSYEANTTFPIGSKVLHALYGEGKVLEVEGSGIDEKVLIKFCDGVKKKFMVKVSPLSIIE